MTLEWYVIKEFYEKIMNVLNIYYNVHLQHIIQVLLMVNLILFKEIIEKNDLMVIIMIELIEIVLQQHKIQHDLMENEKIYCVHVVMHIQQLNLVVFKGIIMYNLKELKEKEMVQIMHINATEFDVNFYEKKKKKELKSQKQQQQC